MPPRLPFTVRNSKLWVSITKHFLGYAPHSESHPIHVDGPATVVTSAPFAVSGETVQSDSQAILNPIPIAENDDPLRRRVNSGKHRHGCGLRIHRLITFPKRILAIFRPPLSPEEQADREAMQYAKQFFKIMRADSVQMARRISRRLAGLGFDQIVYRGEKVHKRVVVRFDKIAWDKLGQEVILHVDGAHLPDNVWMTRIGTEEVATELRVSIGHPAHVDADIEGTTIKVDRAGTMGLPNVVRFRDILPLRPASALPLTFFAGMISNGGREWRSLEAIYHFIGAGSTGAGKSTYMHQMFCTFIACNEPDDVLLLPIDLKFGGVALTRYEGVPHIITENKLPERCPEYVRKDYPSAGVATDLKTAAASLNFALWEIERRGEMFLEDKRVQKIEDWNKHHKTRRLPRIVIFIDELAEAMDKSDVDNKYELGLVKDCRYAIRKILKLGRAGGIHLVGFTQSLDKTVMGTVFKTNIGGRICFSTPDVTGSILVIGDGWATNLEPTGRGVFKHGKDKFICQTPLITEAEINEIVAKLAAGQKIKMLVSKSVTPEDLLRHAIQENSGSLSIRELYLHFGELIEMAALQRMLERMTGQTYTVDEFTYQVLAGRGRRPRRVERVGAT